MPEASITASAQRRRESPSDDQPVTPQDRTGPCAQTEAESQLGGSWPSPPESSPEPSGHEQLAELLRALWPALVRATRAAEGLPALPEAQVAVLRTLVATGGLAPAQLAAELHLARPTISNLVSELLNEGLLERRPSAVDGRSVLLVPTSRARHVLSAFGRGRVEVLDRAVDALPPADRDRLCSAMPSLALLLAQLESVQETRDRVVRHS